MRPRIKTKVFKIEDQYATSDRQLLLETQQAYELLKKVIEDQQPKLEECVTENRTT